MNHRLSLFSMLVAATGFIAACGPLDSPTSPTETANESASLAGPGIQPMCQQGCLDVDPAPAEPGIFIGGTDAEQCTMGTDADADGLADFCETRLSNAFAPELRYWSPDEVGRESKWVARWLDGETVRIGYLLSYYRDAGSSFGGCQVPPIGPFYPAESCFGHNGDPEAIFLDVRFDWSTEHWVLWRAEYSAHGDWNVYTTDSDGYANTVYPAKPGGYPRAYVSQGKHANYARQSECNAGGTFGSDTCVDVDTSVRVSSGASRNLGSRAAHTAAQDCWASQDPSYQYYGSGRLECYWTPSLFRGWIPGTVGGRSAEHHYSGILDQQDF